MATETMASTRLAFAGALCEIAKEDPRTVFVSADSLKAVKAMAFAETYPGRYFDVGIAEQTAVCFAAGLATCGFKPFLSTYAGFITMRACEQVRTFVAYPQLNVKLVGLNGGIYGGEREGVTHQFFEDIAIMRSLPGVDVVVPADAAQARKATMALAQRPGPAYMRVGSGREPVIYDDAEPFEFGRARVVENHGCDAVVFVCGPILKRVRLAARELADAGIRIQVVEVHTIKPLDVETVSRVLGETGRAVTVEDHNVIGGLGSAVAEVIAEGAPARLVRVGLQDIFPESGDAEQLLDRYRMGVRDIVAAVTALVDGS